MGGGGVRAGPGLHGPELWLGPATARKVFALHFPGTTKRHRLEENLGGAALTLNSEDLARIQQALDAVAIVGERYRPERQKLVGK